MESNKNIELKQCIYCLEEKSFSRRKKDSEFNSEHVMHDALGKFGPQTLTLTDKVCKACNQLFGDTIDLTLARGGYEAILRFQHGVKNLDELSDFVGTNIEFSVHCPNDPVWHGVKARPVKKDGKFALEPAPQIGFISKETDKWVYLTEREFDSLDPLPPILDSRRFKIFSPSYADEQRLWRKLEDRGFKPSLNGIIPSAGHPIAAEATFDTTLQRAITKIAFNYLAKVTEKTSLIFDSSLDEARAFVREGRQPIDTVICVANETPILAGDTSDIRQTNGHIVSVEWKSLGYKTGIAARVALFDDLIWDITLSPDYRGLIFPMSSAHYWNFDKHVCEKLPGLKRDLSLIQL